ncbi:MAG: adenylyltransferase/cytidyltransferase family protein [Deltaproteobacteria bacterium]|nr:adenylyltransferase/cytidyltransferase family protein [Deltaproteobacteria bacterium]
MKVWENNSNGQLHVTIPKNSGIKKDDWVKIEKKKINRVVYSFIVGDLFHYGHLRILEKASQIGDLHICGVLTNRAVESYKRKPIQDFKERANLIAHINIVDKVISQDSRDPTDNLKKIHQDFPMAKLILIHGDDWKDSPFPGEPFITSIGGELVKVPYYKKLSTTKMINEIKRRVEKKQGL